MFNRAQISVTPEALLSLLQQCDGVLTSDGKPIAANAKALRLGITDAGDALLMIESPTIEPTPEGVRLPLTTVEVEAGMLYTGNHQRDLASRPRAPVELVERGDLGRLIDEAIEFSKQVPPAIVVYVDEGNNRVEVVLDNKCDHYYAEWIKTEPGDCGLYREDESKRIVGFYLPLRQSSVIVMGATQVQASIE